ncbi:MAG: DUF7121 family protein [Methanobacteriota archaeon]
MTDGLEAAEKRLRRLLERRNELNDQARVAKEERDMLQGERRRILDATAELRGKRGALIEELRLHKDRRNALQARARAVIEARKGARTKLPTDKRARMAALDEEIARMEHTQAHSTLSSKKEEALLKDLRAKAKEREALRAELDAAAGVDKEIAAMGTDIDKLFAEADAEHKETQRIAGELDAIRATVDPQMEKLDVLSSEAEKKHAEVVAFRERADHYHQRAEELKAKVMGLREVAHGDEREAGKLLSEMREAARDLEAPELLDAKADEVIELLKKKGKVSL